MEINIGSCKFTDVTVFRDRAEVQRVISFVPSNPKPDSVDRNEYAIKITGLTNCANMDSIRVKDWSDPIKSTVKCNIIEVSHEVSTASVFDKKGSSQHESLIQSLTAAIEELEKKCTATSNSMNLINKQVTLTEKYVDSMLQNKQPTSSTSSWAGCPVEDAMKLLEFHRNKNEQLDSESASLNDTLSKLRSEISVKRAELRKLSNEQLSSNIVCNSKIVTVLFTIPEGEVSKLDGNTEVCLLFTYVVSNATWVPSYDVRVNTADEVMTLHYYAEVTQKSGEDWTNCTLHLSTSNPAIGSAPPPLQMKVVQYKQVVMPYYGGGRGGRMKNSVNMSSMNARNSSDDEDDNLSVSMLEDEGGGGALGPMLGGAPGAGGAGNRQEHTNIKGSGDAGSTSFTIPRSVSIAGDSKSHKVTITVETFTPQMVHFVVPATSAHVYLQAKTLNKSSYPLLACEENKVSVFLDGNFVSNSCLKNTVSSGETFNMYLGVDPAVKVEYLPCRMISRVKGWVSGTETKTYYYATIIHNTKQLPCKIIVVEQIPRSFEDKITVELIERAAAALTKVDANRPAISANDVFTSIEAITEASAPATTTTAAAVEEGSAPVNNPPKPLPKDFISFNKVNGNVLWLKSIASKQKAELKCTYRVSWPQGNNTNIEIV